MAHDADLIRGIISNRIWLLNPIRDSQNSKNVVNTLAVLVESGESYILFHSFQAQDRHDYFMRQTSIIIFSNCDDSLERSDAILQKIGIIAATWRWKEVHFHTEFKLDASLLPYTSAYSSNIAPTDAILHLFQQSETVQVLGTERAIDAIMGIP
jgi:hypothetical protein